MVALGLHRGGKLPHIHTPQRIDPDIGQPYGLHSLLLASAGAGIPTYSDIMQLL